MATCAYEQVLCHLGDQLIRNLERHWIGRRDEKLPELVQDWREPFASGVVAGDYGKFSCHRTSIQLRSATECATLSNLIDRTNQQRRTLCPKYSKIIFERAGTNQHDHVQSSFGAQCLGIGKMSGRNSRMLSVTVKGGP